MPTRIIVASVGKFEKALKYLNNLMDMNFRSVLEKYGRMGVDALADATPVDTGLTAASWYYEIKYTSTGATITWSNANENDGVNIAIILQYGHATNNGGYVRATDYVNPAMKSVFEGLADSAWREVASL